MKLLEIIKKPMGGSLALLPALAALAFATPSKAEDGYIKSDGNQYINLGHFIGPNTKIEFDFAMAETPTDNNSRPLGARGGQNCRVYFGGNTGEHKFSFWVASTVISSGQGWNSPVHGDTARHVAVIDYGSEAGKCTVSIDLSADPVHNYKTFDDVPATTATQPLIVFAENLASAGIYSAPSDKGYYMPAKVKVYGVTISESGVEVKKFVPCVKGGVAGLKETHSGLFHTTENQLQHPLAYGGDILTEKDDPYICSPRNKIGPNNSTFRGGYENNIFIDTGYNIKYTTRIELDYAMLTNFNASAPWAANEVPYIFSANAYNSGKTQAQSMAFAATANGIMAYRTGSSSLSNISSYPVDSAHGVRRTVSLDSNSVAIVTAGYTNFTGAVSAASVFTEEYAYPNKSLKIGASYAGTGYFSPMRIYGLKIYESGRLVKDYVPFVTNGVGGLKNSLDASDTLFSRTRLYAESFSDGIVTNVAFDVGGNISASARESEAYLEFTGVNGNAINTGYVVTKDTRIDMDYMLWNTKFNSQQFLFEQRDGATKGGIWARVYYGGTHLLSYSMCDNDNGTFRAKATTVKISNHRQTLTLDSSGDGLCQVVRGDETIYSKTFKQDGYNYARTRTTCATNLWIGGEYTGNAHAASMRLYSFKISESGNVMRNYVPCVRNGQAGLYDLENNTFSALAGGKVSGATLKGEAFQIAPEPAKLAKGDAPATLKCLAAGAQSYEWYVDGVKIDGETGETLSVEWIGRKPHTRTYSVKPVYTVFNETVKGDPAEAQVEFSPNGIVVTFK